MFCITQLPAATLAALCAVSIAACCLCVLHAVYAGVHAVKVQSVTGSCLGTCSQCEVLLKILNLHHCSHLWTACHAVCIWLQ
jgi:hypothetical protein